MPVSDCDQAFELNGIKIIRYEESLYFANVENFKYQIVKYVGIVPSDILAEIKEKTANRKVAKPTMKSNQNSVRIKF